MRTHLSPSTEAVNPSGGSGRSNILSSPLAVSEPESFVMINVYFPRCFLVTLFMVSFVLVSVVVMMRFLSEEVVKAFSSSASLKKIGKIFQSISRNF